MDYYRNKFNRFAVWFACAVVIVPMVLGLYFWVDRTNKESTVKPETEPSRPWEEQMVQSAVIDLRREMMGEFTIEVTGNYEDYLPLKGMAIRQLNHTMLGNMDALEYYESWYVGSYKETLASEEEIEIFRVCFYKDEMTVDSVKYCNEDYWDDGRLVVSEFSAETQAKYPQWKDVGVEKEEEKPTPSVTPKPMPKEDPYKANTFEDPEDFYYYYEEDFESYEEAEWYWETHQKEE